MLQEDSIEISKKHLHHQDMQLHARLADFHRATSVLAKSPVNASCIELVASFPLPLDYDSLYPKISVCTRLSYGVVQSTHPKDRKHRARSARLATKQARRQQEAGEIRQLMNKIHTLTMEKVELLLRLDQERDERIRLEALENKQADEWQHLRSRWEARNIELKSELASARAEAAKAEFRHMAEVRSYKEEIRSLKRVNELLQSEIPSETLSKSANTVALPVVLQTSFDASTFRAEARVAWQWIDTNYQYRFVSAAPNQVIATTYAPTVQRQLEAALRAWCAMLRRDVGSYVPLVLLQVGNEWYEIDIALMRQRNVYTGTTRKIERQINTVLFPHDQEEWWHERKDAQVVEQSTVIVAPCMDTPPTVHKGYQCDRPVRGMQDVWSYTVCAVTDTALYDKLRTLFYAKTDSRTCMLEHGAQIRRIERVDHPLHRQHFEAHRQLMHTKTSHLLFHGTHHTDPHVVIADGADPRVARRENMYLGKAFYVTSSAAYIHEGGFVHKKTPAGSDHQLEEYQVLAVECLLGRCVSVAKDATGAAALTRPPVDPLDGQRYDSTSQVAEKNTPIFALYQRQQVYASYIITYTIRSMCEEVD